MGKYQAVRQQIEALTVDGQADVLGVHVDNDVPLYLYALSEFGDPERPRVAPMKPERIVENAETGRSKLIREKLITVYKFRTMTDARDRDGRLMADEARLTSFGRILRSYSLDELPEVFNVLRGEMSLVGPRPLLVQYLDRYTPEQARRHEVLPGMTGWAQVNGRNAITWEDKFRFDLEYVENWSLLFDIKILAITFWKAVTREGISQPGHATAEEFMGSKGERGA